MVPRSWRPGAYVAKSGFAAGDPPSWPAHMFQASSLGAQLSPRPKHPVPACQCARPVTSRRPRNTPYPFLFHLILRDLGVRFSEEPRTPKGRLCTPSDGQLGFSPTLCHTKLPRSTHIQPRLSRQCESHRRPTSTRPPTTIILARSIHLGPTYLLKQLHQFDKYSSGFHDQFSDQATRAVLSKCRFEMASCVSASHSFAPNSNYHRLSILSTLPVPSSGNVYNISEPSAAPR